MVGVLFGLLFGSRCTVNRFANADVGSTAAEIPVHGLIDVLIGGVRVLGEQRDGRHNLTGLAIAALRDIHFDPRLP